MRATSRPKQPPNQPLAPARVSASRTRPRPVPARATGTTRAISSTPDLPPPPPLPGRPEEALSPPPPPCSLPPVVVEVPEGDATARREVSVHTGSVAELTARVAALLGGDGDGDASPPDFMVCHGPTGRALVDDADVGDLPEGATLRVVLRGQALAAPVAERVKYQPHPKTMTMAGDYEYFAAGGQHPFAYALAELVDNAIRATHGNPEGRGRQIVVSLVHGPGGAGALCVEDNGCGMTKQQLNQWAVMNLSMEDRGLQVRPGDGPLDTGRSLGPA